MRINHNIAALNTHRQLGANNTQASKNLEKLSSGLKINRAGDDAAGLAISEKMRGQIRGLDMAQKNAQDGISLIQTAEGALNETHAILQRMRELAVQSANDTNNGTDRKELQKEVDQLAQEITRISENTEFNTKNLLGANGFEGKFHIGANEGQSIDLKINDMGAEALKVIGKELTNTAIDTDYLITNEKGEAVTIAYTAAATNPDTATGNAAVSNGAVYDKDTNTLTITLAQAAGTDESGLGVGDAAAGAITATKNDVLNAINSVDGLTAVFAAGVTGTDTATVGTGGTVAVSTETNVVDPTKGINISSQDKASAAVKTINEAIETVSAERSKLGATQNRLEHTINNLGTSSENLTAAESRIRDVDYVLPAA
ncbi:flagellin [Sporosarcina luteola]|uniref:Flagellin n=1 Tax=Sporosarcina luteola TaxID=582850 RepID=A0A511Z6D0_9BACL|nr:flagellin [Sporosarcina luteola]GEN82996.1 flagellin [Sporosarcina luteola]